MTWYVRGLPQGGLHLLIFIALCPLLFGCGLQVRALSLGQQKDASFPALNLAAPIQSLSGDSITLLSESAAHSQGSRVAFTSGPRLVGLPNGEFLRFGGSSADALIIQNQFRFDSLSTRITERIHLDSKRAHRTGALPSSISSQPLDALIAQASDKSVYFLGADETALESYRYDLESNTWIEIAPLPASSAQRFAFPEGENRIALILVLPTETRFYSYDPISDQWTLRNTLSGMSGTLSVLQATAPFHRAARLASGKIAYRGVRANDLELGTYLYDPESGTLETLPDPPGNTRFSSRNFDQRPLFYAHSDVVNGHILADTGDRFLLVGSFEADLDHYSNETIYWNASSGTWEPGPVLPLKTPVVMVAPLLQGKSLIFDRNGNSYEYSANTRTFTPPVKTALYSMLELPVRYHPFQTGRTALLDDGRLIIAPYGHYSPLLGVYSAGSWKIESLYGSFYPAPGRGEYVGISVDTGWALWSHDYYYQRTMIRENLRTGERQQIPSFLRNEEREVRSAQISDDYVLFMVSRTGKTSISEETIEHTGSGRSALYQLSTGVYTPVPDRPSKSVSFLLETFADRYVLVHSGFEETLGSSKTYTSFELYDIQSNTWKAIGRPNYATFDPAIAYAEDENALYFFGGMTPSPTGGGLSGNTGANARIERYDLASETWSEFAVPHTSSRIASLGAGKFLSLHQSSNDRYYSIIDPATGSVTTSIENDAQKLSPSALGSSYIEGSRILSKAGIKLPDGRIGFTTCFGQTIGGAGVCTAMSVYDPTQDDWQNHALTGFGGANYQTAPGLKTSAGRFVTTFTKPKYQEVLLFDPGSNAWVSLIPPQDSSPSATLLSAHDVSPLIITPLEPGRALWIGEKKNGIIESSTYIHDLEAGTLREVGLVPANMDLTGLNPAILNQSAMHYIMYRPTLIANGSGQVALFLQQPFPQLAIFDSKTGTWSSTIGPPFGPPVFSSFYPIAVQISPNEVLIGGGMSPDFDSPLFDTLIIDIESGEINPGPTLPSTTGLFPLTLMTPDGRLLVGGGVDLVTIGSISASHWYDFSTGAWSPGPTLPTPLIAGSGIVGSDGIATVFGGVSADLSASQGDVFRVDLLESNPTFHQISSSTSSGTPTANLVSEAVSNGERLTVFSFESMKLFTYHFSDGRWEERTLPGTITAAGAVDSNSLFLKLTSGGSQRHMLYSLHPAIPFSISGGMAPYTFERSPMGYLFERLGLYIPAVRGEHRIRGRDVRGFPIQSDPFVF